MKMNFDQPMQNDRIYDSRSLIDRYFVMHILFIHIPITLGDMISDGYQGYKLIINKSIQFYGIITIGIHWIPGIAAAIHIVSTYRTQLGVSKTIIASVVCILFYPILPIIAYIVLLWKIPSLTSDVKQKGNEWISYQHAKYLSLVIYSITGGIGSPIQFIYQIFLILTGVLPQPWISFEMFPFSDRFGNEVSLPTSASWSLIFSALSILKTVVYINITQITPKKRIRKDRIRNAILSMLDQAPFLFISSVFRIAAIIYCLTYLYEWTFIPFAMAWISNLTLGYYCYDEIGLPVWLNSFISLFLPILCTHEEVHGRKPSHTFNRRHRVFRIQTICAFFIYISTSMTIFILVNYNPGFNYNPNLILTNTQFNTSAFNIGFLGVASVILTIDFSSICHSKRNYKVNHFKSLIEDDSQFWSTKQTSFPCIGIDDDIFNSGKERLELEEIYGKKTFSAKQVFFKEFILFVIIALIVGSAQFCRRNQYSDAFIYYKPYQNETRIIKAILLNAHDLEMNGYTIFSHDSIENKDLSTGDHEMSINHVTSLPPQVALHHNLRPDLSKVLIIRRSYFFKVFQNINETSTAGQFSAIVIVDDNENCAKTNENCYRPSYPIHDLSIAARFSIPILFTQEVDMFHNTIFKKSDDDKKQYFIGITTHEEKIPIDTFTCDIGPNECLDFKLENGRIQGKQYRTVSCQWGGRSCLNHPRLISASQNFCDEFDVSKQFCEDENNKFINTYLCTILSHQLTCCEPNSFVNPCHKVFAMTNSRKYRMKGKEKEKEFCLSQENLDSCNRGLLKWSMVTRKHEIIVAGKTRFEVKRYCKISEDCLIEEKFLINEDF